MAKRSKVSRGLDKKIFRRTASSSKKINLAPKIMRGGTRL